MKTRRRTKTIIKIILFLLVFNFIEIANTLSDRSSVEKVFPFEQNEPISHRLNNNLSGYESMQELDSMVRSFMDRWDIVGASVAIAKEEKLIYAKGFGFADKEQLIPVQPRHLFRIASVSKLITATAVMKMQENGELSLEDKVFGPEGILKDSLFPKVRDERIHDITVQNLLEHSSGWTNRQGDPMFMQHHIARKLNRELPLSLDDIMDYMVGYRKLDYAPGKNLDYSNFGYALLGKIIEEKSGISYEDYVVSNILNPLGIYDMHLGYSLEKDRFPNEVKYYGLAGERKVLSSTGDGTKVPKYYGGNYIETLGAAGGWVASPAELMKLMVALDGLPGKENVLSDESLQNMVSNRNFQAPFGWTGTTSNGMYWRTGTLSGTSALMVKQNNDISWVMLINTTPRYGARFPVQINRTMIRGLLSVDHWPDYDLFDYYEPRRLNDFLLADR